MKTLVNIFDPNEPLAAYLFLKEKYAEGDKVLFVSTHGERQAAQVYASLLHIPESLISLLAFKRDEDRYIYDRICQRLRSRLSPDEEYWVNLAGGTRYIALAVQNVFFAFNTTFYYTQTRENLIVSSFFTDDSCTRTTDIIEPIRYRMTLAEYFTLNNLVHDLDKASHTPLRSFSDASHIFDRFRSRNLSTRAFSAIELLRLHYRGTKRPLSIRAIMNGDDRPKTVRVPGIRELLTQLSFVPRQPDTLLPEEIDYLTGGWFEEYVYHLLLRAVDPQEIALGVRISRPGESHNNELDVAFIKANTLFVVECKTGIATDHLFNEIVYKSAALKEAFLGMACHSYIFTLKNDFDHRLARVANLMNITLCPKGVLTNRDELDKVTAHMIALTHEP